MNRRIVSIDLQPMAPFPPHPHQPPVTILCADITVPQTLTKMMNAMGGKKADLIVCDGAPEGEQIMSSNPLYTLLTLGGCMRCP